MARAVGQVDGEEPDVGDVVRRDADVLRERPGDGRGAVHAVVVLEVLERDGEDRLVVVLREVHV